MKTRENPTSIFKNHQLTIQQKTFQFELPESKGSKLQHTASLSPPDPRIYDGKHHGGSEARFAPQPRHTHIFYIKSCKS